MGEERKGGFNWRHTSANRFFGFSQIFGAAEEHETVYMTRAWIGNLRMHIFHRGDQDPDCHDHPWDFWTFPLRSYVEEVLEPMRDAIPEIPGTYITEEMNGDLWRNFYDERDSIFISRQRYFRRLNVVKAFRFHFRKAEYKHRVLGPYDSRIFTQDQKWFPHALIPTFVWRTGVKRKWGFTKERDGIWCWIPWKKYVYEGGKQGPCE